MSEYFTRLCIVCAVFFCIVQLSTAAPTTAIYGAEANPTGNPIGGGIGYSDIIQPTDPRVIAIVHDKAGLLAALNKAKSGDIVYVHANANIDMSGTHNTQIPSGVTIASNRGENGAPGGRIYQNVNRADTSNSLRLFETAGPNVRITGLRLQGPYPTTQNYRDGRHAIRSNHNNFEVDNCEIYHWGYAGIRIHHTGPDSGQYIHHNYIHTNQFSGTGYGIVLLDSEVLIEANLFDKNRHSITGLGGPNCAFEARYNIVGPSAASAYFDMHQDPNNLRWGGNWVYIHHNTFLGTDQNAFNQRGRPRTGAWIEYNIMDSRYAGTGPVRQTFHDLAPAQSPYGNVYMSNNIIQGTLSKIGPVFYLHDTKGYVEPTPYPIKHQVNAPISPQNPELTNNNYNSDNSNPVSYYQATGNYVKATYPPTNTVTPVPTRLPTPVPTPKLNRIDGVTAIADIAVEYGTSFQKIELPRTVQAIIHDGSEQTVSVDWSGAASGYDSTTSGTVRLRGILVNLPGDTINPDGIAAQVNVRVGKKPVSQTSSSGQQLTIPLQIGWNLISVPYEDAELTLTSPATVQVLDPTNNPNSREGEVIGFDEIVPGRAYWVSSSSVSEIIVKGTQPSSITIELEQGWNPIGAPGDEIHMNDIISDPSDPWSLPFVYAYNPERRSYEAVTTLEPGRGYFGAIGSGCTLTIP
ncbi:hypothetical protein J2T58_002226 [Methanocalculus alkaliphilus]|uniref:Ig-like domain-containing protein n=1 Tax=Methanocalculus alkaliphilus TaxID=768730 RepID=UPI00209E8912|nr:Ig-like domain-containing protein [Methanocalculus alkaliphilus]MCP1716349.1 hypothetical protein [Methanocalculus alkaliphilus]